MMMIRRKLKNRKPQIANRRLRRTGAALLVVLFVVMVITILSLGFLSRSDVELACGENMILHSQMDYLAESGLEHARGLILCPQDINDEYWTGAERLQLVAGSDDYYDVNVERHEPNSGPTYRCNYSIISSACREKGGEKIGRSGLKAELRLDPCIALWTGASTALADVMAINGDVRCNGTLTNEGIVNGDVFVGNLNGTIGGQEKPIGELSLEWPRVTIEDFTTNYSTQIIPVGKIQDTSIGGWTEIWHRSSSLEVGDDVQIDGMLIVDGDLTITGTGNSITAHKNVPALLVTGDIVIASDSSLDVYGLAVVEGDVQISADGGVINILGGLFVGGILAEMAADSSGNGNTAILHNGASWQPSGGQVGGALEFDGVDDYAQTADDLNKLQLTGNYTLAVWIKADWTQKSWAGIFSKCSPNGSVNHWTLQFDSSVPRRLVIYHPTANWYTGITLNDVGGGWHHIKIVRNGNTMISYLDDNEIKNDTWNDNPGSGAGHLNIGVDRTASSDYVYEGLIDDVRIYNRAPDANEVYPSADALIGYWSLDEQGDNNVSVTVAPAKTAIIVWSPSGDTEMWGQAARAFFRSIKRN